jgi:hypothetical protein
VLDLCRFLGETGTLRECAARSLIRCARKRWVHSDGERIRVCGQFGRALERQRSSNYLRQPIAAERDNSGFGRCCRGHRVGGGANRPPGGGSSNVSYFEITIPPSSLLFHRTDLGSTGAIQEVVTGDFNRDGKLDMAMLKDGANTGVSIFLGNGDGTFQPLPISRHRKISTA